MANTHTTLEGLFTDIADAIRNKTGSSDIIVADNFPNAISGISTPNLQAKTITSSTSKQTVTPDSGYNGLSSVTVNAIATASRASTTISTEVDDTNDKITITASNNQGTGYVTGSNKTATTTISLTASGAIVTASDGTKSVSKSVSTATQATPSITVSTGGLITASATQTAGYVSAGTKSNTEQLTVQAAQTITPGTSNKTIASGKYLTGTQTIKGDANLKAANIKSGISIFGVSGTYTGVTPLGYIYVTYPEGSTCTCKNTSTNTTSTASNTSGVWIFAISTAGTYRITSTLGTNSVYKDVSVSSTTPNFLVELTYWSGKIYESGTMHETLYNTGFGTSYDASYETDCIVLSSSLDSQGDAGSGSMVYTDLLDLSSFSKVSVTFGNTNISNVRFTSELWVFVTEVDLPTLTWGNGTNYGFTPDNSVAQKMINLRTTASGTSTLTISSLDSSKKYRIVVAVMNNTNNHIYESSLSSEIYTITLIS